MPKETDQDQVCCDLSMRRPGFALIHYSAKERKANVVRMSNVDNKNEKKPHGQMLAEIAHELRSYLITGQEQILLRERGFFKHATETTVLSKVIGVADLYGWAHGGKTFEEIAPKSVKKSVTGNANATKDQVAVALEDYVGKQKYSCDDESDAVAVGIAWLIQKEKQDDLHKTE